MTGHAILIRPIHHFECELIPFEPDATGSTLNWLYFHLQCHTVTCLTPLGGSILGAIPNLDAWGDDEGLFVAEPKLNGSAMIALGYPQLVGNIVLTSHDDDGNTLPLTVDQIDSITKFLRPIPGGTTVG